MTEQFFLLELGILLSGWVPMRFDRNILTESFDRVFLLKPDFEFGPLNPKPLNPKPGCWEGCSVRAGGGGCWGGWGPAGDGCLGWASRV